MRQLLEFYTIYIVCIWFIGLFVGERWLLVGLYRNMLPAAFLPVFVSVLIALVERRWLLVCCTLPISWAFRLEYLSPYMNSLPSIPHEGNFTFLTYNLYGTERDFSPSLDLIKDADADIVVLQELCSEVSSHLSIELAHYYPYQTLEPHPDSFPGLGVLSRFPILEEQLFFVDSHPAFQRVQIQVHHQPVTVFNVHPKPPIVGLIPRFNARQRQNTIDMIVQMALQDENPVVIAGDFNMTQSSDAYARIVRGFVDLHRSVGRDLGLTYPDTTYSRSIERLSPLLSRLDYIFHSYNIQGIRIRVWPHSGGSDHRPVWGLLHLHQELNNGFDASSPEG